MKRAVFFMAATIATTQAGALSAEPVDVETSETDPAVVGWMQGFPPARDKQVRAAQMEHYTFPKTRWAFSHMRQLLPTVNVWRGKGPISTFPYSLRSDLDQVTFVPVGSDRRMSWEESLKVNYTDAIIVLHRGDIVYERYFGVTTPQTPHMSFSMTKSYVGTLAAMLIERGALDERKAVSAYIPALERSGFGDATVRQVLDMTTGLDYAEVYSDPDSGVFKLVYAAGFLPAPKDYQGPDTIYSYLPTVRKKGEHGERFTYNSVNTDVLGWLLSQATGKRLEQLLSDEIWQKLGAEMDAYIVSDPAGTAFASGGFNATLRDQARFGEMIRQGGFFNGQQIVPRDVVEALRGGGDRLAFEKAGWATLPGWSYRDQWWVSHNANGAFAARGVHGQTIYIDPAAEMVIVRLASYPTAANANLDPTSLPAYQAIADHLTKTRLDASSK